MRTVFLLLPLVGAAFVYRAGYNNYTLLLYLTLGFISLIMLMTIVRGPARDAVLVLASITVCLVGLEAYEVLSESRPLALQVQGFAGSKPILGWGAVAPGSFAAKKTDPKSGAVIYDTRYTIDDHLLRRTSSADHRPTVAFFGDSFMFGEGLPDAETLPQLFADSEDRKVRVLNLAFPGYGPQQFLRALETRMYDDLLRDSRLFVFETAAWHAERTACTPSFMLRAPRYVLKDGRATYAGACAEGLTKLVREVLGNSAAFRTLIQPAQGAVSRADIDLYIAVVRRAVEVARDTYKVRTLILYLPFFEGYLSHTGYSDADIMQKLRDGGAEVLDGRLNPADHPGVLLHFPADGHPTGAANRLWAAMIKAWFDRQE